MKPAITAGAPVLGLHEDDNILVALADIPAETEVAGGVRGGRVRADCFMLSGSKWVRVAPLPEPLYCAGAARLGDETIVFGQLVSRSVGLS